MPEPATSESDNPSKPPNALASEVKNVSPRAGTKVQTSTTQQHKPDSHPRDSRFHDILLVRRAFADRPPSPNRFRFDRFRVAKEGAHQGSYLDPENNPLPEVRVDEEGYRPVINLASTAPDTKEECGPVFSALPLNPDPAASSSCTCYLLNPENLNYVTAWTAEEWSDRPGDEGPPLDTGKDVFNLLIASPGGKVYYLEKTTDAPLRGELRAEGILLREVDLAQEAEIWSQLRNGCVVGRTRYDGSPAPQQTKVTPLVNIHSLMPTPRAIEKGTSHAEV